MRHLPFFLISFLIVNISVAQPTIIHDDNAEMRSIGKFDAIKISGGIDLFLLQDVEEGLAVSAADAKDKVFIKTVVENGMLKIWVDEKSWRVRSEPRKLIAYVSFSTLKQLSASGASDVFVNGTLKGDQLIIKLSGASDFKGTLQVNRLSIEQSGASDATISGKTSVLEVEASGASDLKGFNLESDNCTARAFGASDIKITVNNELIATARGASSIYYKGTAEAKEVRASGASNINKKS